MIAPSPIADVMQANPCASLLNTRATNPGNSSLTGNDLEEAAYASCTPKMRTMWRVFFPLLLPTFVGVWIWAMLLTVRSAGKPLILYEDAENQVLAILIWNMWDGGEIEAVGAIGSLLIVSLLLITLLLRRLGFGRGSAIQHAGRH